MGERLYYNDAYLTEFDAIVEKTDMRKSKQIIALNRSAFYPTSGGQPYDTGFINDIPVTDVFVDEQGDVWHETEGCFATGDKVHGKIDWDRRFDHMQQHAGEHMIAGAVYTLTGGDTIGLYLGPEISSIDIEYSNGNMHADDNLIDRLEDYVNTRIQQNHKVCCRFPDKQELELLPLRKKPSVSQHVRIVEIGDFEMVACGGTHPSTTGQIGLVKILSAAPSRGKLRITFVCGMRAFLDYRRTFKNVRSAANLFSTHPDNLAKLIASMQKRLHESECELTQLKREKLLSQIPVWIEEAEIFSDGTRLVCRAIEADAEILKDIATEIKKFPNTIALLGARDNDKCNLIFACSKEIELHMGKLLSDSVKAFGGKGGGSQDFARGCAHESAINTAKLTICNYLNTK